MNNYIEVVAIVEGRTEQVFVERVLAPYLSYKNISIRATQISKSGQKGGDVKFSRAERDIGRFLKQRPDIYVTQFFDYYGLKEWPDLDSITTQDHTEIAQLLNEAARGQIVNRYGNYRADSRFIPYMAMHEFEALLFSDEAILADELGVGVENITAILTECKEPEKINNSRETAPSKRLAQLKGAGKFKKAIDGISIADRIGVETMRQRCPLFNEWLNQLESKLG
ncbi:DUF4276 family protein [Vibrio spartinae]|uniref:DUF4276 domain-containing protein n=1 Tax=Vibrio spartinae TaxID=1918945 RepID=A0A1N6M4W9_9VIBR|nr:DUF4276 family protein [Vibrio spartinae]QMV16753.1 hypothetical protein Vspart_04158 [Vibrio spartinae]SIO94475.1 hypothetical protein VSP9026_02180 [Vibrio spartinae]